MYKYMFIDDNVTHCNTIYHTRKTITNQKVYLIKSTGALMIEQVATDLVFPTMTCPLTGKKFKLSDVLELKSAASGFSASGSVEAKVYRPSLN